MQVWEFIKRSAIGTVVSAMVLLAIGVGFLFITGDLRPGDIAGGSSKIETDHNDTHLVVNVDSEHNSDGIVLRHPDNKDYFVAASELKPFGGEYTLPANVVRCDDANFPDRTFEVALVSYEADRQDSPLTGIDTKTDTSQTVTLSEGFVNGECTDTSPF